MFKDGGKRGYLKYVFFTHICVTMAFSITNNKKIRKSLNLFVEWNT